jgi:serine/threonine-protein kinase
MAQLAPGFVFAGHRIERLVGKGGMGLVYLATDLTLDRKVALKLIAPEFAQDASFRERFKRESKTAAALKHPNVVTIFHAGEHDEQLFVTMEFVEGTDLREMIKDHGQLEVSKAATILSQVADALDAAHARGLVHRDVKPGNILIESGDGPLRAYLGDFGLAKPLSSESGVTATGVMVGTTDYVAPEQVEGRPLDARTDVYALGCVLFHALAGQVPYPRDTDMAKLYAHVSVPPPSLREVRPDLDPELDRVIQKAMAKDPSERYSSAGELAQALLTATEGTADVTTASPTVPSPQPVPATQLASPPRPASPPRRTRSRAPMLLAGGAALLVLGVIGVLVMGGGGGSEDEQPAASLTLEPTFAGDWTTTHGEMSLTQSGESVSGTYEGGCGPGTISGTVSDETLTGEWTQEDTCNQPDDEGAIVFELEPPGDKFTGRWSYGSATPDREWDGTRDSAGQADDSAS